MFRTFVIAAMVALLPGCGCNGTKKVNRPVWPPGKPKPPIKDIIASIKAQHAKVASYRAKPIMDYWFNKKRIKGDVWIMGKPGAKVRINALNPSGGTTAADLACNGTTFKFVNINNNCQLTGPCDSHSIAQLLGVRMQPDDFLMLAIGSTPIIVHNTTKLSWDYDKKLEVLELWSPDKSRHQIIKIKKHDDGNRDVVSSEVKDAAGKTEWKLRNKDFHEVKSGDGNAIRVPKKTNYVQPEMKNADVLVWWEKVSLNVAITDDKFDFNLPGIPTCGRRKQQPAPAKPAAKSP